MKKLSSIVLALLLVWPHVQAWSGPVAGRSGLAVTGGFTIGDGLVGCATAGGLITTVADATIGCPIVPGVPQNVAAAGASTTSITETYQAPATGNPAIFTYTTQIATSSSGPYTAVSGCVAITALTCTAAGLTNGATYYFEVAATNTSGTGAYSSYVSAVAQATTPLTNPAVLPVSVWLQSWNNPVSGTSYSTAAAATAAMGANIALSESTQTYPESYGADSGEFAANVNAGLWYVPGYNIDTGGDTSANSIASIKAVAASVSGGTAKLLGYNEIDEPGCPSGNTPLASALPGIVTQFQGYDGSGRGVWTNYTAWMATEYYNPSCTSTFTSAIQAAAVASFDLYPITKAYGTSQLPGGAYTTDFNTVPNDTLFWQALAVQGTVAAAGSGQRIMPFIDDGSDEQGNSETARYNTIAGTLTSGSPTITITGGAPTPGSNWVGNGLTVSGPGIPVGSTGTGYFNGYSFIVSSGTFSAGQFVKDVNGSNDQGLYFLLVSKTSGSGGAGSVFSTGNVYVSDGSSGSPLTITTDPTIVSETPTTLTMSVNATANETAETIQVGGGAGNSSCIAPLDLCVAQGQRWRAEPYEVNASAWISIINGARGFNIFCYDFATGNRDFCLGDTSGNSFAAAATASFTNLTYVVGSVQAFAPEINATNLALCDMDSQNSSGTITIATSCSNNGFSLSTSSVAGAAIVKSYGGATYVMAMLTHRGSSTLTYTLASLAGKTATIVYDSNAQYASSHNTTNNTIAVNGSGTFTDTLGAYVNYAVKIYKVQ